MKKIILIIVCAAAFQSCKKIIEVSSPQNQLTTDKVFVDTTSALAALGTIYGELDRNIDVNYSVMSDLYTDNLSFTDVSPQDLEFYHSKISPDNSTDLVAWQYMYQLIYECNDLIAQVPASGKLPQAIVQQITNEAKFIRAFIYFKLINAYGNVPLLLTTDVNVNAVASRADMSLVIQQIIKDLTDAKQGLTANYQGGGRVRANNWAAAALLSQVYLFQHNWTGAETEASGVINSGLYALESSPATVFLSNNNEAILQVWNQYGYVYSAAQLVPDPNSLPLYIVSSSMWTAFEAGDLRKEYWIGTSFVPNGTDSTAYYFYNKYKNTQLNTSSPEYLTVLRLAEQYLVRAEARAELGKITGSGSAAEDVNKIRVRAGLTNTTAVTQITMLAAIMQERRLELFGEWGSRFCDLKRTGLLNMVMEKEKATWSTNADLWPIPLRELTYDHALVQNPGY
ncbi:RagB/SusD family nutrient uptake outer membrane protein [Mucilaginibacter sp. X5P1]|uniref:RagB/SusD family nutrient uptake outer membrane protein n=1 Tax=Mucilaginibacter sp. X5P1 TaxID=2723088 RepID=UPI0016203523|nr:RagB/SusD family nutrient uptake outer membrane protein [Mucilaginibacter sp. X5P1]MBB6137698.1 hypothetical protein [Mucilaginibacter sp. X5P1]